MTIDQALHTVDELHPNQLERARKVAWLSQLDKRVYREVLCRHHMNRGEEIPERFDGYDQHTDPDTELLIREPYDEVYRFYLEMHIDLANQEFDRYNNSMALYSEKYGEFARAYHRTHRPLDDGDVWSFNPAWHGWRGHGKVPW